MKPPRKPFIVKIQKALSHPGGPALIYDQRRHYTAQAPWDLVKGLFKPGEVKVFARAQIDAEGMVQLSERVPDPGW